jgi:hypothetical protein
MIASLCLQRARAEYIAGHNALESFLRPNQAGDSCETNPHRSTCWRLFTEFSRWSIFVSLVVTGVWSSLYLLARIFSYEGGESSLLLTIVLALICLVMSAGIWVVLLFFLGTLIHQCFSRSQIMNRLLKSIDRIAERVVKMSSYRLFGIDRNELEGGLEYVVELDPEERDEVIMKLESIEKLIDESVSNAQNLLMEQNLIIEKRLVDNLKWTTE